MASDADAPKVDGVTSAQGRPKQSLGAADVLAGMEILDADQGILERLPIPPRERQQLRHHLVGISALEGSAYVDGVIEEDVTRGLPSHPPSSLIPCPHHDGTALAEMSTFGTVVP
jgi:hypothetical protein